MVAPQSVEEIRREFGVTRECIRQIKAKAPRKIQYPDQNNRIFPQNNRNVNHAHNEHSRGYTYE